MCEGLHCVGRFALCGEVCTVWGGVHCVGRCALCGEVCIVWGGLLGYKSGEARTAWILWVFQQIN